jgi:hypothetical protein
MYQDNSACRKEALVTTPWQTENEPALPVERVQLGVRMEKRMVKVLKALAEYYDVSLGQLLEDIVLHSFEGAAAFGPQSRGRIEELKRVYGMNYDNHACYRFADRPESQDGRPDPAA